MQYGHETDGRGDAAGVTASGTTALPLLLGISSTLPAAKEIVSAKIKSDELFLRFLATPQARDLVQLLLDRRSAVDAPELLLPSPSSLETASPLLLSPVRLGWQSPRRPKGLLDDAAAAASPRRDSPHQQQQQQQRSPWKHPSSPPSSPSMIKTMQHSGRAPVRQSHPMPSSPSAKASPRTPKPSSSSPARVSAAAAAPAPSPPSTPPVASSHVSVSPVCLEHVVGGSGKIWRKGYAPKAAEVVVAERLAIEQIFTDAGTDTFEWVPAPTDSTDAVPPMDRMAQLLRTLQLPQCCRSVFAQRVSSLLAPEPSMTYISRHAVMQFYTNSLMYATPSRRIFNVIRQDANCQSLRPFDWTPLVQYIADHHPGLAFLRESGDFLPKYVATVVVRLFHDARVGRVVSPLNPAGTTLPSIAQALLSQGLHTVTGRSARRRHEMTFEDFEAAELASLLHELDVLSDLTRYPKYFDYISFYTIYCKFWELDSDRDMLLRKEDVLKYGDYSLSSRIVDRLFEFCRFNPPSAPAAAALSSDSRNEIPMTYQDFVYLLLSNIDTSASASIELWFQCLDIDGDGVLSPQDVYYVYEEQLRRMEYAAMDILPFDHAFTQILDMVKPARLDRITLGELKKCGQSADIFHLLFNLSEFENDEQRYPLDQSVTRELTDAVDDALSSLNGIDTAEDRTQVVTAEQKNREASIGKPCAGRIRCNRNAFIARRGRGAGRRLG